MNIPNHITKLPPAVVRAIDLRIKALQGFLNNSEYLNASSSKEIRQMEDDLKSLVRFRHSLKSVRFKDHFDKCYKCRRPGHLDKSGPPDKRQRSCSHCKTAWDGTGFPMPYVSAGYERMKPVEIKDILSFHRANPVACYNLWRAPEDPKKMQEWIKTLDYGALKQMRAEAIKAMFRVYQKHT